MREKLRLSFVLTTLLLVLVSPMGVSVGEEKCGDLLGQRESLQVYSHSQPPETEWNKTYGRTDEDVATSVVQTYDGGYILAGGSPYAGSFLDSWLVRTDGSGNMLWNKPYEGAADAHDILWSVIQTYDGGYAAAGYTTSFGAGGSDFWLVKIDSSGNDEWNKTYGGDGWEQAYSFVQTSDGGYAILGEIHEDLWLVKTDASGDMEWNKTYSELGDCLMSVVQTGDGGYAIARGTDVFPSGDSDFWLGKTDSYGNMLWNRTYGGAQSAEPKSVVQTGDGGYAIAGAIVSFGAGKSDFWLVKTDSAGNMQWNKTYGGSDGDSAYSFVQTSDGGYAIAGYTWSFGAGKSDFWLVKTDSAGNMQWNKTCGGADRDTARSVVQTSDGGYAIAGGTESFGAGDRDFWLIKLAGPTHDVAVTDVAPSKTVVGQDYSMSINVTVENQGDYTETFNVTAYYDSNVINYTTVTNVLSGEETTLTFTWDTTGVAKGNYNIKAKATPIPGETDTADNTLTGWVVVTVAGDVNGDCICDMADISMMIEAFMTTPGDEKWDPNCDVNCDDIVDMADISIAIDNFMKTCEDP